MRNYLDEHRPGGEWHVVAVGKAAGAMTLGALDSLGSRVRGGCVALPPGHLPVELAAASHGFRIVYGAHPLPDESSLAAGEAIAEFVATRPLDANLLFLISGGASSLVDSLKPGITLAALREVNRWALASGAPIDVVNSVRRRLSNLKGGGLARLAQPRRSVALMVSDVPGDDPHTIGSGLLHSARIDPHAIPELPSEIATIMSRAVAEPSHHERTPRIPTHIVANLRMACHAAAAAAQTQGMRAVIVHPRFAGEATALGQRFARALRRLPAQTLQVRGGESTVALPAAPGRGGRNQHLALSAAVALEAARTTNAYLLAAGTDGIDGISVDAGALVDAGTCIRGRDGGFDPHVSLARADSGRFLEASGDLLHTGPTLTNVGDLVLGLRWRAEQ